MGIHPSHVLSSDQFRADMCGDFRDQTKNDAVFAVVHSIAKACLAPGLPVVIDATHLRRKDRHAAAALVTDGKVRYILIDRPTEEKKRDVGCASREGNRRDNNQTLKWSPRPQPESRNSSVLVAPEIDRRNRRHALTVSAVVAVAGGSLGWLYQPLLIALVLAPVVNWLLRRRCLRRIAVIRRPFPAAWQAVLEHRVRFYCALDDAKKERFRQMASVFLDEVLVTGVRTEVDDTVRVLVAAGAIIPVFGFEDWEYHRLGEVLVYPGAFDKDYQIDQPADADILGLTGLGHLRGVVILSKPSLLAGFSETPGPENVGVHEFVHLVEQGVVDHGLPPEVPLDVVRQWVGYVARELSHPSNHDVGISDYAYTNEHEFFAVLSEYFFGSPETLRAKAPALYDLLRKLFHQDPAAMVLAYSRGRAKPNGPCPCGSGETFEDCCQHAAVEPSKLNPASG